MGVMILDDGKMNLTEKSLELWLFEDLLEQLSHVFGRIGKCTTTKGSKNKPMLSVIVCYS